MEIVATAENKAAKAELAWLKRRAAAHLKALGATRAPGAHALSQAELSLVLTTDARIRVLNKSWRHKDKATDVLSFPLLRVDELRALGSGSFLLGDVIISLDTARRQAAEIGHSLRRELDRLLVHGILHVLGYDHELGAKEARRMQRLEKKLLTR